MRAAHSAFLERGFDATTFELIAENTGVHRDTLYRRYESKAKLFHAVVESVFGSNRNRLARSVGSGGHPRLVLRRVARQLYADTTSKGSIDAARMVVAASLRFPELGSSAHEGWAAYLKPLIEYLEAQRVAGALQLDNASEAAYAFSSAVTLPFRALALLLPRLNGPALERHLKRVLDLHLKGWQASAV